MADYPGEILKMKYFILGFFLALIIGVWVMLAIMGFITVKIAIIVPTCIAIGGFIAFVVFCCLFAPRF